MSLNLENIGKPLARIVGGKYNNKVVSVYDKKDDEIKEMQYIKLKDDEYFQIIPGYGGERDCLYICGASGSGKSTFASKFIKDYIKQKKKKKEEPNIYLFSAKNEDEALDDLVQRVDINDDLIENPITIEETSNCLLVYDDIDVINNKKLKEAVWDSLNNSLQIGRSYNVSVIITNHLPTMGKQTGIVLFEYHSVTFFPNDLNRKLRYMLESYCGLSQQDIDKLKKIRSRSITIFRHYPKVVMSEKLIFMLNDIDSLYKKGILE
jgi:Cdc6-like AAA superfamily ATPase